MSYYEKCWVKFHETEEGISSLKGYIADYKAHGLGQFMKDDGTPISLKALLVNRFFHWNYDTVDGFKRFYMRGYLGMRMRNGECY